ncbi:acyltransferase [Flavobacterium sp. SM15]|uniref:acyltransferase family protein n=1 Tax=Flavobacterium sp. SM15 TaxID=2908005 RepID=UPI001EDAAE4C|nr:acyltransferase [Flavobacterium sp. SM15]MCG2611282.1 acyltransferase [Flavobacterium sp. SM15]
MQQVQIQQLGRSNYLDILQVYRGFAALLVVFHHAVGSLGYYHSINIPFLNTVGTLSKLGVDFFFVLSGFIITYSASFKYEKPHAFREHILARLLRIYIPYLPIGIGILILYNLLPTFSNSGREISIFTSLTLIPYGEPALSIAWTLLFELMFYLLFSISFFSKKAWNLFVICWVLLIFLRNYGGISWFTNLKSPFLDVFFSTYNLEFILGFLLAQMVLKKIKLNYWVVLFSGLFLIGLFLENTSVHFFGLNFSINILFTLFVFFLIYFSVMFYNIRLGKMNLLMLIGNATYSIYLTHNPLQALLIRICPKISTAASLFLVVIVTIFVCSFVGYIYYFIFEKWGMAKVKMIIDNKFKKV